MLKRLLLVSSLSGSLLGCARAPNGQVSSPASAVDERDKTSQLYADGMALASAGDLTRSEQYLATALRLGHDPERTLRSLLAVCVQASRLRSALAYAEPHLLAHPSDASLRQLVASLHLALGDVPRAERELTRVLAAQVAAPDARFLLATVLQSKPGRQQEAARLFKQYLALRPDGGHAEEARASAAILAAGPGTK